MKKIFYTISALMLAWSSYAQAPNNMTYQSVVRDGANELVTSANVGVRVTVRQGTAAGTSQFEETHTATSNDNGLISFEIGSGSNQVGSISGIDWANGPFFLQVEIDPAGGTNYTLDGTTQLMSVPYAMYSNTAGSATTAISVNMPLNDLSDVDAASPNSGDVLSYDGTNWSPITLSSASSPWTEASGNVYRNSGNVGVNTTSPDFPFTLTAAGTYGANAESVGISVWTSAQSADGIWENEGIRSTMDTDLNQGRAISGTATGGNSGVGVNGQSYTNDARGVYGGAYSSSGDGTTKFGVFGEAAGSGGTTGTGDHYGVVGSSRGNGLRSYGVIGESYGTDPGGYNMGVTGFGRATVGVWNVGVYGEPLVAGANVTYGVIGANNVNSAVYNTGVYGTSSNSTVDNYGIDGTSSGDVGTNYGTTGWAFGTGNVNYAIYGQCGTTGSTNYAGYFEGDVHVTGVFTNPSDKKLKENISEVKSTTDQLMSLGVYNYTYKQDGLHLPKGMQYGFIAQEVESQFPELVKEEVGSIHEIEKKEGPDGKIIYFKNKVGEEHYKAVNYIGLVPVVTKSLQEQVLKIEELEKENAELKERLEKLEKILLDNE